MKRSACFPYFVYVLLQFVLLSNSSLCLSADKTSLNDVSKFLNKYCVSCHGDKIQEGDRRFDQLSSKSILPKQNEAWHEILGRLNLGDMPPEDAKLQPTDAERLAASELLTKILSAVVRANQKPQTAFRRLNRIEYDNAVRKILGLEKMLVDPTADFTPDESIDHFTNVGETLILSDFLMTRYLEASAKYLKHSRELASQKVKTRKWKFSAPFYRSQPNPDGLDRDGEYQHIRENPTYRFGYMPIKKFWGGAPAAGNYRIRVKASAIDRLHPYKEWIIDVPREDPLQMSIVAGDVRTGDMATNNSTDKVLAVMDVADDKPEWYEATVWLDKHYQPRLGYPNGPAKIKYMRHLLMHHHRDLFPGFIRDRVHVFHTMHPDYDKKTAPALAKAFLDEQEMLKKAGKPYDVFGIDHSIHTNDAWLQFYSEYKGPRLRIFEVEIEGPLKKSSEKTDPSGLFFPQRPVSVKDSKALVLKFASKAYRRPVTMNELQAVFVLYENQIANGESGLDALQTCYQAILCSPGFLYHRTKNGNLDAYELASRLSFFIWATPPDEKLLQLAADGSLLNPKNLATQVKRMLSDPRSDQMVENFIGSWLHLDKLGTMLPDRVEHPAYYNERLEEAMRTETRLFVSDAITHNRGVSVLIDSDYSFLNSSLARLYGISGVSGHQFRKVKLKDRRRGGLLGQASILTASANGIDTSPVLRGIWVMECLLGTPPSPPPPDVEPLEPDIRGATTIREQLAKHRTVVTCNKCHRRIDPPGFALESFDEIGRFRKNYTLPGYGNKPGQKIDPSGVLASGEPFDDVVQMKSLLEQRADLVAQNLARKLLIYATGRIDDPNDEAEVLSIGRLNKDSEKSNVRKDVGIREIIHRVVKSNAFRR